MISSATAKPQENPESSKQTPADPNAPLAKIEVTADEIRQGLIKNQQDFQIAISRSATERQQSNDFQGFHDVIDASSLLNREHVHGIAQICVAERPHLREKVGVFPTVHLTEIVYQARTAVYNKIVAHEAYKAILPSKSPLIEVSQCKSKEELEARNKEEKHRAEQEKELDREAIRILNANKFTLPKLVQHFLEAMSQGNGLLGNPHKKDLTFDACSQVIIPIRTGDNYQNASAGDTHYDVVVVKLNREAKKAEMTFYDSLCWKLSPLFQKALEGFFKEKGFEVSLKDVSNRDQADGYNCGMFAALKGVEIASQNEGIEEKLIASFKEGDYQNASKNFRCLFGYALQSMGYNIVVDKSLESSVSVSHLGAATLKEFARLLDEISNQVQKMSGVLPAHSVLSLKSLVDLKANDIFERCDVLRDEIETVLKQKLSNDKKDPTDVENIKFLFNMLVAINLTNEEYKAKIKEIAIQQENKTPSWFSKLSWPKRILYGSLALGSSLLGGAYLIAYFLKFTALLPANPLMMVFLSSLGYVALHEKLNGKKAKAKAPTPSEIDDAAAKETLLSLLDVSINLHHTAKAASQSTPSVIADVLEKAPGVETLEVAPLPILQAPVSVASVSDHGVNVALPPVLAKEVSLEEAGAKAAQHEEGASLPSIGVTQTASENAAVSEEPNLPASKEGVEAPLNAPGAETDLHAAASEVSASSGVTTSSVATPVVVESPVIDTLPAALGTQSASTAGAPSIEEAVASNGSSYTPHQRSLRSRRKAGGPDSPEQVNGHVAKKKKGK